MRIAYVDMNEALTREAGAGGPVFSSNLMRRLPKYMEVVYLPSSLTIANIRSDKEALRLASALEGLRETGLWVPDRVVEFLEERAARLKRHDRIMAYLDLLEKEADVDFYLDLDYAWQNAENAHLLLGYTSPLLLGDVFYLAKRTNKRALALVQAAIKRTSPLGISVVDYIRSAINLRNMSISSVAKWFAYDVFLKFVYPRALMREEFAKVFFMSAGQMASLGLPKCDKCEVLRPAAAVELSVFRRAAVKDNIFAFAGRRVINKGILELPYIYAEAARRTGAGLVVTGRFYDGATERAFAREVRGLGLESIKLTGWLSKVELYELLSRAKVILYPSHTDSFSFVILESLACGTPVVAYDIPALHSLYGDLPAVRFVREFDRKAMAEEAVRLAVLSDEERGALLQDERVVSFLKEHSSWDIVADRFAKMILALSKN